jgi:hypothetical protein
MMMVTKSKAPASNKPGSSVKVAKLKLNKETIKELSGKEAKEIKGGKPKPIPRTAGCSYEPCE